MRQEVEFASTEEFARALEVLVQENKQMILSGSTNRRLLVWPISIELLNQAEIHFELVQAEKAG